MPYLHVLLGRSARVALAVACCVLVAGCGRVDVQSVPPGAEVYVDGHHVGRTPCVYRDRGSMRPFGAVRRFRLELAGYKPAEREVRQEFNAGMAAIDCLLVLPAVCIPWEYYLEGVQVFVLEKEPAAASGSSEGGE